MILFALLGAVGFFLPEGAVQELLLAMGLAALAGGITSKLLIQMLFHGIPGIVGSGVLPGRAGKLRARLKEIFREQLREEDLRQFWVKHQGDFRLQNYLASSAAARGIFSTLLEKQWERISSPEAIQPIVDRQIDKLMDSSVGGILSMVGIDSVKPAVNQFVSSLLASLKGPLLEISSKVTSDDLELPLDQEKLIADVQSKIHLFVEERLESLDPATFQKMFEEVIGEQLGWLVVWGNAFGALFGGIAFLLTRIRA